jgi:hypothetical protein
MSVLINASTSTGLVQSADTSGEIELQSNGTTALKVNTNEGIQILNCLGVGNATPSTSGSGITFPASQSASTDANTLDDYEEGTFTPSFSSSGASFTYDSAYRVGRYTKVGNKVTISVWCSTDTSGPTGTLTNQLKIINMPFTAGNNNNSNSCALAIGELYNVVWTASKQQATAFIPVNTTDIALFWEQSNTGSLGFIASNLSVSTYILLSGSYFV